MSRNWAFFFNFLGFLIMESMMYDKISSSGNLMTKTSEKLEKDAKKT